MNVKPGDLAIVVLPLKADASLLGAVVEVVRVDPSYPFTTGPDFGAFIRLSRPARALSGHITMAGWCKDKSLRPLPRLPDEQHTEEYDKQEA